MNIIDKIINHFTMYRLILYYLIFLLIAAVIYSGLKILPFNFLDVLTNALYLTFICWMLNLLLSKIFRAPVNAESSFITSLILALIITPTPFFSNFLFLSLAAVFAMVSKFILAINKKHIFNPTAIAVVLTGLIIGKYASWWIGQIQLLPYVIIGGFLIVRKIQRFKMVLSYILVSLLTTAIYYLMTGNNLSLILNAWQLSLLHAQTIFFAIVMLTEPRTSPTQSSNQLIYSTIVGVLSGLPQLPIISFPLTPEMALCVGNIYNFVVSPKFNLSLKLKQKIQLTPSIYSFYFERPKGFDFKPGQYLEWTLPYYPADGRGNRRFFSIASSPTEEDLMVTIKVPEKPSSFKKALLDLKENQEIVASHLAGEFVLPDPPKPSVFIAGGIGITPFRSMIKDLLDQEQSFPATLFYSVNSGDEIVFRDILDLAEKSGVKIVYTLTNKDSISPDWKGEVGYIDEAMIKKYIPTFKESTFYLSGPQMMVETFEGLLSKMGVPGSNVKHDYFPGYD